MFLFWKNFVWEKGKCCTDFSTKKHSSIPVFPPCYCYWKLLPLFAGWTFACTSPLSLSFEKNGAFFYKSLWFRIYFNGWFFNLRYPVHLHSQFFNLIWVAVWCSLIHVPLDFRNFHLNSSLSIHLVLEFQLLAMRQYFSEIFQGHEEQSVYLILVLTKVCLTSIKTSWDEVTFKRSLLQ